MKAIQLDEIGGEFHLVENVEVATAGLGQILVRNLFTAINPVQVLLRVFYRRENHGEHVKKRSLTFVQGYVYTIIGLISHTMTYRCWLRSVWYCGQNW